MKLIECPRDAMQGMSEFVDTATKIEYIQSLIDIGFDTIDAGSFVSAKAIPQMRDSAEVFSKLKLSKGSAKLLAIIANERGAVDALQFDEISYLGFPFSISETFQQRNTNSSIQESLQRVEQIQSLCVQKNRDLVVYISMAFGNPYNDPYNIEVVEQWTHTLANLGIKTIAFADTIGISNVENIKTLFEGIVPQFPAVEFGAHLHSRPEQTNEKIIAALEAGCTRFDAAIYGFGGCPMASDDLTGNVATEKLLSILEEKNIAHNIQAEGFQKSLRISSKIFNH